MKHSRMSAQSSYRQMLKAGMSRFLPAPLFPMAIAERTFAGPVDSSLSLRSSWRGIRSQRSATASLRPAMSWGTCFPLADASARPIKDLPRPYLCGRRFACGMPSNRSEPEGSGLWRSPRHGSAVLVDHVVAHGYGFAVGLEDRTFHGRRADASTEHAPVVAS